MSDSAPAEGTLTARTARGAAWALIGRGLHQALGAIIGMVVLRRLLSPADYGLVGMALVFVYLASELRDLRFADALIQRKELDGAHLDTVFFVHAGVGLVLTLVLSGVAPLLALFYRRPDLTLIAAALGLKPLLDSVSDVPHALLTRRLAISRVAIADLASVAVGGGLAIVLAIAGFGPWALVALNLSAGVVRSAVLIHGAAWVPSLRFSRTRLAELRKFSVHLYAARLVTGCTANLDKLLVGRFLGHVALGIYSLAYSLMTFVIYNVSLAVGRVMFSALSEVQGDLDRFRSGYTRSVRLVSLVTFPMTAGLWAVAPEFIRAVPGEKWLAAIPALRLLSAAGFIESVTWTAGWIYLGRGRTDIDFLWSLCVMAVTAAALVIGIQYGVVGVAAAYLVRTILLAAPTFLIPFRLIGLRLGTFLRPLLPAAVSAVIMAAAVSGLSRWILPTMPLNALAVLAVEAIFGAAVYGCLMWLWGGEVLSEAIGLLRGLYRDQRSVGGARQ